MPVDVAVVDVKIDAAWLEKELKNGGTLYWFASLWAAQY